MLDATVGGANANSFISLAYANSYFENRQPLTPTWDSAADPELSVITATQLIKNYFRAQRVLVRAAKPSQSYYLVKQTWTGTPSTTTQRLPFPRIGMYDANGNLIPDNVIPNDLGDATAELAGQLNVSDLTKDNDTAVQGIESIKAGSVAISFKNDIAVSRMITDYVLSMFPSSWLTDEKMIGLFGVEVNSI